MEVRVLGEGILVAWWCFSVGCEDRSGGLLIPFCFNVSLSSVGRPVDRV